MQVILKLLRQLRKLQLQVSRPASALEFLQSSSTLTSLQLLEKPFHEASTADSPLLAPALSQLTGLQELTITGRHYTAHDSIGAALAGMPRLTQLVLQPQLPAAALGQLPGQLMQLQLANVQCDAAQLVAHVEVLQQLRSLTQHQQVLTAVGSNESKGNYHGMSGKKGLQTPVAAAVHSWKCGAMQCNA
jgi:hypothetical protein